jgi:hypothetical protein
MLLILVGSGPQGVERLARYRLSAFTRAEG